MSKPWSHVRTLALALAPVLGATRAAAQCLDWSTNFGANGVGSPGLAMAEFDDGSGPALFVGGSINSINGVAANGIGKWNGTSWSMPGGGVHGYVRAMTVFDDGTGPALYVGGNFDTAGGALASSIARWNGTTWSKLSTGVEGSVLALAVYDDGSGPALFVGGDFQHAGSVLANNIAKWNGGHWSTLGGGIAGTVSALQVSDNGAGAELVVGGLFDVLIGSAHAYDIAKWNGSIWSALGTGMNGAIRALTMHDSGSGPELYAGGAFTQAGGDPASHIARWDGAHWSALSSGTDDEVHSLASFDSGSGPALYAGGFFTSAGGSTAYHIARWDGGSWSTVGGGIGNAGPSQVYAISVVGLGGAPALFAGGNFVIAGGISANNVARFDGSTWHPLGVEGNHTLDNWVHALTVFDDGSGPALYAGGSIFHAGGQLVNSVAKWNGTDWTSLGVGISGGVTALEVFDDGQGPALYVAGSFWQAGGIDALYLAKWNGAHWAPVPGFDPVPVTITTLQVFDDGSGPALFVGGRFTNVAGITVNNIAKWNGVAWSALGNGLTGPVLGTGASTLVVHDDGGGPALIVGGTFETAGSISAHNVARWNGSSFAALSTGLDDAPSSFATLDDGGGPALYAGGNFTTAGGLPAVRIARWDGSNWSALPSTLNDAVQALAVFDDGAGLALYAGGKFTSAGGAAAYHIAKWDGAHWSSLAGGIGTATAGWVYALHVFDDGADGAADLYAGGSFTNASSVGSFYIAEWRGCSAAQASFCAGDGTALACPCGNSGMLGRGCQNSASTGGASLAVSGTAVPDTIVLSAAHELPNALSIFLQGNVLGSAQAFGDGLRCAGGQLKRLYVKNASSGTTSAPQGADPSVSARSSALGDPIAPGTNRYYQTYYRDPNLGFCPLPAGNSWNVTNAVRIAW